MKLKTYTNEFQSIYNLCDVDAYIFEKSVRPDNFYARTDFLKTLTHQNEIIVEFNRALKISSFYCILSAYLQVRILISFGKY